MRWLFPMLLISVPASAERVVVQRGETLEHVAATHGCTTEAVERANGVTTSLVAAGTVVEVPSCGRSITARAQRRQAPADDDAKAKQALAVIDGATWVEPSHEAPPAATHLEDHGTRDSLGVPWAGKLAHGEQLAAGDGYLVRTPARAFGAKHVVEHLRHVIAEVRALYPDVPTLAIGDLSAEHGGKISDHRSHQSGLDVDVGFYFTKVPASSPVSFTPANASLDLEATWALLAAFSRTAPLDDGVAMIFLDYDVQKRLYDWAKARGTPDDELDFLFQYPHARDELTGLVRHWPNHANHLHVRFKPFR